MPVAPFDSLPSDVIREIFLTCLIDKSPTIIPPGKIYTVQLVVSQVCSRWRAIALDIPHLWDEIALYIGKEDKDETALKLARLWFDRARNLPCSLDIRKDRKRVRPLPQGMRDLIFTYKFKSLRSNLARLSFLFLDRTYENALSRVEDLHLDFSSSCRKVRQLPNFGEPWLLPCLKSLELNWRGLSRLWEDKLRMIPWYQLRRLNLRGIVELSTVVDILSQCDELEECDICLSILHEPESITTCPSHPMPNLRSLTLSSTSPILDMVEITKALVVPNLISLRLVFFKLAYHYAPMTSLDIQRLARQFRASLRNVQSFEFVNNYEVIDVGQYLACMPYVHHLTLQGEILLDEDIAKRIATGNLGSLLETLSFWHCPVPELVLDMIEERQNNARKDKEQSFLPLTCITFGHSSTLSDQCRERVARLEREHEVRIEITPALDKNMLGAR